MRVLLIHCRYQQHGGEDAAVESEHRMLAGNGVEVMRFGPDNQEIHSYSPIKKALIPFRAVHSSGAADELRRAVADFDPDVAYIHNIYPLLSPAIYDVLNEARVAMVQVAHNFRPFCQNGLLYSQGEICERCITGTPWNGVFRRCFRDDVALSAMYAAATGRARQKVRTSVNFVALTAFAASTLQRAGVPGERVSIRPNAIDCTGIAPQPGTGRYGLYIGRLTREKGVETLLKAAALTPSVEYVIAGTGPEEDRLRTIAGALPNVRFAGFVAGRAKQELLNECMFTVVPSEWYENFPVSILEAFRTGKPVIASNLGGIPEIVRNGVTGALFQAADYRILAEAVSELAAKPDLRRELGTAARRIAEREYNPARWFERTIAVFAAARTNSREVLRECVGAAT